MRLTLLSFVVASCFQSLGKCREDAAPFFYKGHDLSSLKLCEGAGSSFVDTARGNHTRPAEDILGDGGMNTVRLRSDRP
jgi:arabinogalactan endo-1,4-beta-galactosidase